MKIIVDSGIWIALFYKQDDHRNLGILFDNWFKKQKNIQIYINDHIISEVIARIIKKDRNRKELTKKIIKLFLNDERINVLYTSKEVFLQALEICKKYEKLSLVDSLIMCNYYQINPNCLLSYDQGFNSDPNLIRFEDPNNLDNVKFNY